MAFSGIGSVKNGFLYGYKSLFCVFNRNMGGRVPQKPQRNAILPKIRRSPGGILSRKNPRNLSPGLLIHEKQRKDAGLCRINKKTAAGADKTEYFEKIKTGLIFYGKSIMITVTCTGTKRLQGIKRSPEEKQPQEDSAIKQPQRNAGERKGGREARHVLYRSGSRDLGGQAASYG